MLTDYQESASPFVAVRQKKAVPSLSELWAKKYVRDLQRQDQRLAQLQGSSAKADVAQMLRSKLRSVSAQAWNKTETLLDQEVQRHQISLDLIDPWTISKDVHRVYEAALTAYAQNLTPQQFSLTASKQLGKIRQVHTAKDPRVIGFVSMQFHYCGQMLCQVAPREEGGHLQGYFKVVDDLLYMPLHRAYEAAANYDYHHPRLETVRLALPAATHIANRVVDQVIQYCPNYVAYTGPLDHAAVRVSSVRDVEMFQIYLWTCVLEGNIGAIAQELFPLCVMLYPTLRVSWGLVRLMINLLDQALADCVGSANVKHYEPHYQALLTMFSPDIFPDPLA